MNKKKTYKMSAIVGFRYDLAKKEILTKSYGDRLPDMLRKAADQLVLDAISNELIKIDR